MTVRKTKSKKPKLTPPSGVVVYEQDMESQLAGSPGKPIFGWDELGRFVTGIRVRSLVRRMREEEDASTKK